MKKKILSAVLAATLVITSVTPTFATPNEEVIQNQKKYDEFTQKIEEINDKIYTLNGEIEPLIARIDSNNAQIEQIKVEVENTENEKNTELQFERPVEGDIVRDFAVDSLIFSETLQEWTTHTGVDIKADKTTVIKAAEAGTVKTIKNDPRYGMTVVIEHANGFKTVYSNLLTSEFVVEGEKVEKGQSIGTVGNTAAFEIADEPHLHFEILKDNISVDPNIYLK